MKVIDMCGINFQGKFIEPKNISKKALALEGSNDIFSVGKTNSLDITAVRGTKFLKSDELIEEGSQKLLQVS